ncbi:hydroxycarboxylic acid receptor 2-like [Scophthalmus maximus]|uniref:hydroxycarboxylic acid receptor 2-like n=1 Tax=Scophthalmus maximus TaxID=52904 RepID=UPI0015E1549B|nr:hydroxycarboxylic acid receptor 2-like [Scophthalmus maximus]
MLCHFNGTLLISVLPPLLVTEIVLGILGNGFALWVFLIHLKPWKSSTVILFNLAAADFLLIMALPFRASYYMSGLSWMFGGALCNICLFMLAMNRTGSTFFLMAIAVDRYMRVVHPHHPINSISVSKAMFGALAICHLRERKLAQHAKIKKALCFITLVVVVFITCFLPSNIVLLLIWFKTSRGTLSESEICPAMEDLNSGFYISISLTYLNSVLDPVVYYFSTPAFKNICRKVLHLPQAEPTETTEGKTRETGSQSLSQL